MSRIPPKLTAKQEEAVLALLSQRNLDEAAAAVGVSVRTLFRWMKEADFDQAYRDARRAAFGQAVARLQQMSSAAVTTLGKALVDPATPPSTRVRAAESILNQGAKGIEIEDIAARVTELEKAVDAAHADHPGSTRR